MLIDEYAEHIHSAIDAISSNQRDKLMRAAELAAKVIQQDGLIYVFGCGHSHILSEETFYRAGGLVCVAPVFYEPLMLHESAALSSKLEKQSGLAQELLKKYQLTDKDMLICISTSDKNAVPVEYAQAIRKMGIPIVGICSGAYSDAELHNACGKHLHEVCDFYLDNMAPYGDACLKPIESSIPMTPLSSITGIFIINSILAEAAKMAFDKGTDVPVYLSGNIPGGAEKNQALIERYSARIPHL